MNIGEITKNLRLKLGCSVRYGEILDEQFEALNRGDADRLAATINEMDECYALMLDLDKILKEAGCPDSLVDFVDSISAGNGWEEACRLFSRVREIARKNMEKMERNRQIVLRKQTKEVGSGLNPELRNIFASRLANLQKSDYA